MNGNKARTRWGTRAESKQSRPRPSASRVRHALSAADAYGPMDAYDDQNLAAPRKDAARLSANAEAMAGLSRGDARMAGARVRAS